MIVPSTLTYVACDTVTDVAKTIRLGYDRGRCAGTLMLPCAIFRIIPLKGIKNTAWFMVDSYRLIASGHSPTKTCDLLDEDTKRWKRDLHLTFRKGSD